MTFKWLPESTLCPSLSLSFTMSWYTDFLWRNLCSHEPSTSDCHLCSALLYLQLCLASCIHSIWPSPLCQQIWFVALSPLLFHRTIRQQLISYCRNHQWLHTSIWRTQNRNRLILWCILLLSVHLAFVILLLRHLQHVVGTSCCWVRVVKLDGVP